MTTDSITRGLRRFIGLISRLKNSCMKQAEVTPDNYMINGVSMEAGGSGKLAAFTIHQNEKCNVIFRHSVLFFFNTSTSTALSQIG